MDKSKSQPQAPTAVKTSSTGKSGGRNASVPSPGHRVASSSQQSCKSQPGGGRSQSIPSCSSCGTIVTKQTKALQCDRCLSTDAWKCAECLNLSEEMYTYLVTDSHAALRWFCDDCDKVVTSTSYNTAACQNDKLDHLLSVIEKLMSRYENIEKELINKCDVSDLERMDVRIKELEEKLLKYDSALEPRLSVLENQLQTNMGSCASEQVHQASDEDMIKLVVQEEINKKSAEERDMENRKKNLILYRVPEKVTDNVVDRKTSDTTFVIDMLDAVWNIKIKEQDIEKMYRLGRWTEDKVRPLLVAFKNADIKDHIMANLRDLSLPFEKFRGIGVSHDLHPNEREKIKAMIEEAKQNYTASGNDDVENFKFLVVGQGQRRKVIKVKRHKSQV